MNAVFHMHARFGQASLVPARCPLVLLWLCAVLLSACGPTVYPAGPPVHAPSIEQDALITRDGARLPLRSWHATGPAKGTIIALHGYTDYSAAFEEFGPWLAQRGYDVLAYDQRGFGEAPHPGYWAGTETMVADLEDAITAVRTARRGSHVPLYLLGESMGGSVAMVAVATMEDPPAGLILAAPGVRDQLPWRPFWDAVFASFATVTPGLTVEPERDDPSPPTARAATRLREDPLVIHEVRADSYDGLITLADQASAAAAEVEVPTLILYGGKDTLVREISLCAAVAAIPTQKQLQIYPGAPHLVLHWQQHDQVWHDIIRWLDGQRDYDAATC